MVAGWGPITLELHGIATPPAVAVLTACGTWEDPQVGGYETNVVDGLYEYVNDLACYRVPIPYPASFGPVGGPLTAASYQQSITDGIAWVDAWLGANPTQPFVLGGYSQGAELVSRIAMELISGSLTAHAPRWLGGYTFGNPCRAVGATAPGVTAAPGGGISSTRLPATMPVPWADYVHSPANGDAGLDMYASVPDNQVGTDMTLVYTTATNLQFNNLAALSTDVVNALVAGAKDLFPPPTKAQAGNANAWINLLGTLGEAIAGPAASNAPGALTQLLPDIENVLSTTQWNAEPIGLQAAWDACMAGLAFLTAPGGPTAPHVSYLGNIQGYSNLVAHAVGFLADIATSPASVA